MPSRNTDPSPPPSTEAAISITTMAHRCGLSRARFYELIVAGIMPQPCYCLHTRRPLYPRELIEVCLEVRATNIGANGRYILFYNRSTPVAAEPIAAARPRRPRSTPALDERLPSLREGLTSLGMVAISDAQITTALASAFPAGTNNLDQGTVLASVFRLLRGPQTASR